MALLLLLVLLVVVVVAPPAVMCFFPPPPPFFANSIRRVHVKWSGPPPPNNNKKIKATATTARQVCRTYSSILKAATSDTNTATAETEAAAATTTQQQQPLPPSDVKVVSSMPEPLPNPLKHSYYLLRHGQSTANVAGIISSARSNAYSERHGLTALGYEQGASAAQALVQVLEQQHVQPGDKLIFVSSPFARAKQTAEACLQEILDNRHDLRDRIQALGLELVQQQQNNDTSGEILLKDKLMERYFGRLDNEAIYTYAYVWPVDRFNVTHTAFDVESVAAVCTRIRELIVDDLEKSLAHTGPQRYHVVMASHADVLQITQLYAAGVDNVGAFSAYRFGNGEVRAMQRTPDSLPEPVPLEPPKRSTEAKKSAQVATS